MHLVGHLARHRNPRLERSLSPKLTARTPLTLQPGWTSLPESTVTTLRPRAERAHHPEVLGILGEFSGPLKLRRIRSGRGEVLQTFGAIHLTGVAEPVRYQDTTASGRPRATPPAAPQTHGCPSSLERPTNGPHVEKG